MSYRVEHIRKEYPMSKRRISFNYKNLTSYFEACGLSKPQAYHLASQLMKQFNGSGPEWMVKRIKAMREWYISYLAGDPKPCEWCKVTKHKLPGDAWLPVFRLPFTRALSALSVSTMIEPAKEPTKEQVEKFHNALGGISSNAEALQQMHAFARAHPHGEMLPSFGRKHQLMELTIPTPYCITGTAIPICKVREKPNVMKITPGNDEELVRAYIESWRSIPQFVIEWLYDVERLDWLPPAVAGNAYQLELNRPRPSYVGVIGFLQQEEFKARTVANPNRIIQHLLEPLFDLWSREVAVHDTDCTFDEEEGTRWVQTQLEHGRTLSGADMSSASDLLDLDLCLWLVNNFYFKDLECSPDYLAQIALFREVSRGLWWNPALHEEVHWTQGQPLGAIPSFMLLTLTNNALARWACKLSDIPMDSFRVHGDDVIIDSRALDAYTKLVEAFGGVINLEKTLTSNRIAEFNGKIITPTEWCNKKLKVGRFSDDSFMDYAHWVGPASEKFMTPRQRRVWRELRYVPGYVYQGPWSQDSWGYPLVWRVEWWETAKQNLAPPDPDVERTIGEVLQVSSYISGQSTSSWNGDFPWSIDERAYQGSASRRRLPSGDPRRWHRRGKSSLQYWEAVLDSPHWLSFEEFLLRERYSRNPASAD
jgi:hypothetical protein